MSMLPVQPLLGLVDAIAPETLGIAASAVDDDEYGRDDAGHDDGDHSGLATGTAGGNP